MMSAALKREQLAFDLNQGQRLFFKDLISLNPDGLSWIGATDKISSCALWKPLWECVTDESLVRIREEVAKAILASRHAVDEPKCENALLNEQKQILRQLRLPFPADLTKHMFQHPEAPLVQLLQESADLGKQILWMRISLLQILYSRREDFPEQYNWTIEFLSLCLLWSVLPDNLTFSDWMDDEILFRSSWSDHADNFIKLMSPESSKFDACDATQILLTPRSSPLTELSELDKFNQLEKTLEAEIEVFCRSELLNSSTATRPDSSFLSAEAPSALDNAKSRSAMLQSTRFDYSSESDRHYSAPCLINPEPSNILAEGPVIRYMTCKSPDEAHPRTPNRRETDIDDIHNEIMTLLESGARFAADASSVITSAVDLRTDLLSPKELGLTMREELD